MMAFLMGDSIWVYVAIFFGKIIEVAITTLRLVLINRGERVKGSIIAFFDVILWLLIASTVLAGAGQNIKKILVYGVAVAVGNYLGSWLEAKLAFGISSVQVIMNDCAEVDALLAKLRANNFAVTVVDGQGKDGHRKMMIVHLRRRRIAEAVKIINSAAEHCVIAVHDISALRGAYIKK
jgi:uncharacterized protein YebE (UPF0316 family)